MTEIISGFPGIGKTYFQQKNKDKVLDSDSSSYSWTVNQETGEKQRNPDFPENYINFIKSTMLTNQYNFILVSSHKEVRKALVEGNIDFTLVYPAIQCKEEYIVRFQKRGSPKAFTDLISKNWDIWLKELRGQAVNFRYVLSSGQYLSDVIIVY